MVTYQCTTSSGIIIHFRQNASPDRIDVYSHNAGLDRDSWAVSIQQLRSWPASPFDVSGNSESVAKLAGVHFINNHLYCGRVNEQDVKETSRLWGRCYPRIWHGRADDSYLSTCCPIDAGSVYGKFYTQSVVAAESLFDELVSLFRYIEPSEDNAGAYGHRCRELCILACTEVEACLRAVLEANTPYSRRRDRYTTADYFQIREPLKLNQWCIRLRDYPQLPKMEPFKEWDAARPTHSLNWYAAYNAIKHDREGSFHMANLGMVLLSMAALYVMQCAQWGPGAYGFGGRRSPFFVETASTWDPGDFYVPDPEQPGRWVEELYFL